MIAVSAEGMLSIHPKSASVSGVGSFEHTDADGNTVAVGTLEAIKLISFTSYGPSPEVPPSWEGGRAEILVQLFVGGEPVAQARLTVTCLLPGGKNPASASEGISLQVRKGLNFHMSDVDPTLFIRQ